MLASSGTVLNTVSTICGGVFAGINKEKSFVIQRNRFLRYHCKSLL